MNTEITGKVVAVLPTLSGNGRSGQWVKNSFVIEYADNGYTQHLCLEVIGGDKWDKMKQNVVVGNTVVVRFSVSSREYQNKWFTSASCFYCANAGGAQQQTRDSAPQPQPQPTQNYDSLPF